MIKISKRTGYALIALLDMAGSGSDSLVTSRLLSQKYNIPPEIMGKVLQRLAKSRIIISQQGINGGYRLNQPLSKITLYNVIKATDGPLQLVECKMDAKKNCGQEAVCMIKQPMENIQQELTRFFTGITLEALSETYGFSKSFLKIEVNNY